MNDQIIMTKGTDFSKEYTLTDEDGDPIDLSSDELVFTVDNDREILQFERQNVAAGGDSTEIEMSATTGVFIVHIIPANTTAMAPGIYYYDIMRTDSGSKITPLVKNHFILELNIT